MIAGNPGWVELPVERGQGTEKPERQFSTQDDALVHRESRYVL
jgi:hypothetical protein